MLHLLDRTDHALRLRRLLQRWRAEEEALRRVLDDMENQRELSHREAARLRLDGAVTIDTTLERCAALQSACDDLCIELVHVRMAVLGLSEELAAEEQAPPTRDDAREHGIALSLRLCVAAPA